MVATGCNSEFFEKIPASVPRTFVVITNAQAEEHPSSNLAFSPLRGGNTRSCASRQTCCVPSRAADGTKWGKRKTRNIAGPTPTMALRLEKTSAFSHVNPSSARWIPSTSCRQYLRLSAMCTLFARVPAHSDDDVTPPDVPRPLRQVNYATRADLNLDSVTVLSPITNSRLLSCKARQVASGRTRSRGSSITERKSHPHRTLTV
ncbi:hypothetical protein C8Q74DRAFT_961083 [Fomes fomentarius]|nr:hypothetical protein C8Q74DRAFT_961083 [Fomes fomentarius]